MKSPSPQQSSGEGREKQKKGKETGKESGLSEEGSGERMPCLESGLSVSIPLRVGSNTSCVREYEGFESPFGSLRSCLHLEGIKERVVKSKLAKSSKSPDNKANNIQNTWLDDGNGTAVDLNNAKDAVPARSTSSLNSGHDKSTTGETSPSFGGVCTLSPAAGDAAEAPILNKTAAPSTESSQCVTEVRQVKQLLSSASQAMVEGSIVRPLTAPESAALHSKHLHSTPSTGNTNKRAPKQKTKGVTGQSEAPVPEVPTSCAKLQDSTQGAVLAEGGDMARGSPEILVFETSAKKREGPQSEGIGGSGAVKLLLKQGGGIDVPIMRGLLDVQQRYLNRMNYSKGAWITQLEEQLEIRRPLAIGFMEARRVRRLAELEESLTAKTVQQGPGAKKPVALKQEVKAEPMTKELKEAVSTETSAGDEVAQGGKAKKAKRTNKDKEKRDRKKRG